jgi:hypothetical protein
VHHLFPQVSIPIDALMQCPVSGCCADVVVHAWTG